MSIKLSKIVAFSLVTALSATPTSLAIQCSKTEALLGVSYTIDEESWAKLRPHDETSSQSSPELIIRPSGNIGSSTSENYAEIEYGSFEDVADFETCIPMEGACVELTVSNFPTDTYNISWNGEAIKVGQEFTKDAYPITSTEIGDFCTPTCDEDTEALFDYEYWTSGTGFVLGYRVEDQSGNMVLECANPHGICGSFLTMFSMYRYRACLPKDTCYTFLTGHGKGWIPDSDNEDAPSFSFKYNGEVVEKSDSRRFISSAFGSNCVPKCNPDTESKVEFIMIRDNDMWCRTSRPDLDYNWSLTIKNADGSSAVASSGVVPHCPTTPFFRETVCIPKNSCASFHIESQEHILTDSPSVYSLTMDGISYRNSDSATGWNQTTNIGTCTVDALCDLSNQALLELELRTPTQYTLQDGELTSVIPHYSMNWVFAKNSLDSSLSHDPLHHAYDYNNAPYELGAIYRTIECVPDGDCEYNFNMTNSSPVEKYSVKRNGAELSRDADPLVEVTPFGKNCAPESKMLRGNAFAGTGRLRRVSHAHLKH